MIASKPWTREEVEQLRELALQGAPIAEIARVLGRTSLSIRAKADAEGIFLKPWRGGTPPKRDK
jgi:hypothetical protein